MKKSRLGFPLEYGKLSKYFDARNIGDDTDAKNGVIEHLLTTHRAQTVLDLTCGTGSQVFFLTKRGYKCVGADISHTLLEIARTKAHNEKIDVKFIDGDMRTLKVGKFDAVITIFNAIGHLTKAGLVKAVKNIHNNLKSGGIYIFDILNLQAMTDTVVSDLAYCVNKKFNDSHMYIVQFSTLDRNNGHLTSYDNYSIQENASKPKRFSNKFSLQIYTAQELREMLAKNGFETIDHYAMDGSEFLEKKSLNILTVARKA